jgi:hypothetical protein
MFDDKEFIEKVQKLINDYRGSLNGKYEEGELYLFVGTRQKHGKKGVHCFQGPNANEDFNSRVCEAIMDILINDSMPEYVAESIAED